MSAGMSPEQVVELKHTMTGLAEVFRAYYESLRKEGFTRREAMEIVLDYQRQVVRGAHE